MSNLITCKDCGKEISKNAKTCPHCGAKIKKLGLIAKVFIGIIGLFVLIMIIGSLAGDDNTTTSPTSAPGSSVSKPEPAKGPAITKENYDKLNKGMTQTDVKAILGEPSMVSETEAAGIGKMEMHHYQEGFSMEAIDVTYMDGKVYSKNWTKL